MKNCFYCGTKMTLPNKTPKRIKGVVKLSTTRTRDHKIPRSRGGKGLLHNTVFCCEGCNIDKGSLTSEEYRVVIAFRAGLIDKPDILFNAERLESLWPPEATGGNDEC